MEYMKPFTDKVNLVLGVITSVLAYIFGEHWWIFFAYALLNIADFVTRWIAARLTKTESSNKTWPGILKKLGYWIMIALSFGMSAIFIEIGDIIGMDLGITTIFGWFVLLALIVNEFRSILENLVDAGFHIPKVLISGLETANKMIAETTDDNEETEKENNK